MGLAGPTSFRRAAGRTEGENACKTARHGGWLASGGQGARSSCCRFVFFPSGLPDPSRIRPPPVVLFCPRPRLFSPPGTSLAGVCLSEGCGLKSRRFSALGVGHLYLRGDLRSEEAPGITQSRSSRAVTRPGVTGQVQVPTAQASGAGLRSPLSHWLPANARWPVPLHQRSSGPSGHCHTGFYVKNGRNFIF